MPTQYSHQKLSVFRTCPRKYKFRYIDRVEIPKRVSAAIFMGQAVHRQLAKAYRLGSDGAVYPLEDMVTAYKAEWDRAGTESVEAVGEYQTVDQYIHNGEEMLRRVYDKYQPFNQGKLLGVEHRIRFTLPDTSYGFIGIIDRLWKRDDGVVEVCDYKTGKFLQQGVRDSNFLRQMGIYQLAVQASFPHFEQIEVAQYFLKHDEILRHCITSEELDELTVALRSDILEIIRAERLDEYPTQEDWHCDYCDYIHLCPAKRHRLALEAEEAADNDRRATLESAADLANRFIEVDTRLKELRQQHEALKEDVIRKAKQLGLEKLAGKSADVTVKSTHGEQFVTKSTDPEAFARLSALVREWQLDEYLSPDARALMKDLYRTQQLSPQKLEELKKYVVEKENHRVTIRRHKKTIVEE